MRANRVWASLRGCDVFGVTIWRGCAVASTPGCLILLDLTTGRTVEHQNPHRTVRALAIQGFDRMGYLGLGSEDGRVTILDSSAKPRGAFACEKAASCLSWTNSESEVGLVVGAGKEVRLWQGDTIRAVKLPLRAKAMCVAFGQGEFVVGMEDGEFAVFRVAEREPVAKVRTSGVPSCVVFVGDGMFAAGDSDCNAFVFDVQGHVLYSGKTRFEPVTACVAGKLVLFGGVAGRVDVMSWKMVRVGGFKCDSEWIWDIVCENSGRVVIATKNGVEMMALEFDVTGGCGEGFGVFRNGLASVKLVSFLGARECEKNLSSVILRVACYGDRVMIVSEKGIGVFIVRNETLTWKEQFQVKVADKHDEIVAEMTKNRVFVLCGDQLSVMNENGQTIKKYQFAQFVSMTAQSWDRIVVVCQSDNRKWYDTTIVSDTNTVPGIRTDTRIVEMIISDEICYLDNNCRFVIYNPFEQEVIWERQQIKTFACSDRIDNLVAVSTGAEIEFRYQKYQWKIFAEGDIFGFHKRKIMLVHRTTCDLIDISIPIADMVNNKDWETLDTIQMLGLTDDERKLIASAALRENETVIANNFSYGLELHDDNEAERRFELAWKAKDWKAAIEIAIANKWQNRLRGITSANIPSSQTADIADTLLRAGLDEVAIQLLKKHHNTPALATALIDTGNWLDAIDLAKRDSTAADIVFPKLVPLLFSDGYFFESLASLAKIPDSDTQTQLVQSLFASSMRSKNYRHAALATLAKGIIQPDLYWTHHTTSLGYLAVTHLQSLRDLPLSEDDAGTLFSLSFYILACAFSGEMPGLPLADILLQLLRASAILRMKRWVTFAAQQLATMHLQPETKSLARYHIEASTSSTASPLHFACPTCGANIYTATKLPRLTCGRCHTRLLFSGPSCRPLHLHPSPASPTAFTQSARLPRTAPSIKHWDSQSLVPCHFCRDCGLPSDSLDFQTHVLPTRVCPLCQSGPSELATLL